MARSSVSTVWRGERGREGTTVIQARGGREGGREGCGRGNEGAAELQNDQVTLQRARKLQFSVPDNCSSQRVWLC